MTSVFESVLCRVMVLLWFWHSYLRFFFFFFVSLKQAALAFRHHWPDIHASTSISSLEAMEVTRHLGFCTEVQPLWGQEEWFTACDPGGLLRPL